MREFQGTPFTTSFKGKLEEDKIVGSSESPGRDGEMRTRDWEATRDEDDPEKEKERKMAAAANGTWQWTFAAPGGQTFEPKVKLKYEDNKLTGTLIWGENEVAIEDAKLNDKDVSFKVVRERDGEKFTTKYTGKLDGDTLKGKVDGNWGGQDQTMDWEAKRTR
jgi:hypothetical protein